MKNTKNETKPTLDFKDSKDLVDWFDAYVGQNPPGPLSRKNHRREKNPKMIKNIKKSFLKKTHKKQILKAVWCGAAWFLPSLDGVAVAPIFLSGVAFLLMLWVAALFSSLRLGGAAWSPLDGVGVAWSPLLLGGAPFLSLVWVVVLSPLSSVGSRCLVFLHGVLLLFFPSLFHGIAFHRLLWVALLVHHLLMGGAAWFPPLGGTTFPSSSVGCCCLPYPPAFPLSSVAWCCLVSFFFGWCCDSPLLWRGAAFLPLLWAGPRSQPLMLGGCCFPFPPFGWWCFLLSLFGWVVLLGLLLLWKVLLFQSPFRWCCFPSPPLGGAAFHPSSAGWCCLVSLFWAALLFFLLLLGGAAWFPSSLGGVPFPISFQVVLPSFRFFLVGAAFLPSSGWYCLVSSFCWVVLLSKIKKKRRKVCGKLKTLAKWKKENWKNEENEKMRKTRKNSLVCGLLKSSAYGWPQLFVAAEEKTIVLKLGLRLKVDPQILVVYNCFWFFLPNLLFFFFIFTVFFMSVIF